MVYRRRPPHYNLQRLVRFKILLLFLTFVGYDTHLILHKFEKRLDRNIKVIKQNVIKYFIIEWGQNMVIRNSFEILTASLKQLATFLK